MLNISLNRNARWVSSLGRGATGHRFASTKASDMAAAAAVEWDGRPLSLRPKMDFSRLKKAGSTRVYIDEEGARFPSVTSILSKSNRSDSLLRWKESQIALLGEQEFKKQQSKTLSDGTRVHALIESYLTAENLGDFTPNFTSSTLAAQNAENEPDSNRLQQLWDSVYPVLKDITRAAAVETSVFHPRLKYAGTIDAICEYKGQLRITDWKTSKKRKYGIEDTFDNPLQLAAYMGALYTDSRYPEELRPTSGMIVVMYDHGPATPILVSKSELEEYWNDWLKRYTDFQYLMDHGNLPPLGSVYASN